jgi:8-oxo-dGTP diphosphatase
VAGVIVQDERALVIRRRDNNRWEPPGGILEPGESILDGLAREVFEETGIRVEPLALTGVYKNMKRGIVALVFRCKAVDGQPRPTEEVSELQWMNRDEILTHLDQAYSWRVLDAFNDTQVPAVRAHDGVRLV